MATDSGASITPGPQAAVAHRTLRGIRNQGAESVLGKLPPASAPSPLTTPRATLSLRVAHHHSELLGHPAPPEPLQGRGDRAPEGQATLQGE